MSESDYQAFVHIKQHNIALLLTNYLSSLQIKTKIIEEDDGYAIHCHIDQLAQTKQVFEEFIKNPNHPKYQQAAWQHGEIGQVKSHSPSLYHHAKENFLEHAGRITLTIFALCWLTFLGSLAGWARPIFYFLQFYPQLSFDAFIENPLRLLGPALFHFSWLHIVFNTMWWWQLGGSIERVLGKGALLNLFLISAIFSNLGQYLVSGAEFGGLSGVVYALVGFVWWMGWLAPEKGLFLSKSIIGFLLFWLMLGFVEVLPVNIANTAHLIGLISGCLLAVFTVKVRTKSKN